MTDAQQITSFDVNTVALTNEDGAPDPNQVLTLNIRTDADRRDLLREMLPKFLRVVKPREDGLLDTLLSNYLLSDTDNESLSGKDVRTGTDQARKLWFILNKVPLDEFMRKAAPQLCALYPHIIPTRFVGHAELDDCARCLRCAIQGRIRETSMADMLYHRNFLDLENYGDIIAGTFEPDCVWMSIFSIFDGKSEAETEALKEGFVELLRRYNMHIPPDDKLKESVSLGLPCTCVSPVSCPPVAVPVLETKVLPWLLNTCSARSSGTSSTPIPPSTRSSGSTRKSVSDRGANVQRAEAGIERPMPCDTASVSRDADPLMAVVPTAAVGGVSVNVENNEAQSNGASCNGKSVDCTFTGTFFDSATSWCISVFHSPHFLIWLVIMCMGSQLVYAHILSQRSLNAESNINSINLILREHSLIPPQSNSTSESPSTCLLLTLLISVILAYRYP